jgi:hydrogenase nickel incorporation protein HypA/HybF
VHEFAICSSLLRQVQGLAEEHGARRVISVKLAVGALSGVEPGLLDRAFEVARRGGIAAAAELIVETPPIIVRCRSCGGRGTALPNRLICAHCGDFRVELASGDELILVSVEMECDDDAAALAGGNSFGGGKTPREGDARPCVRPADAP